MRRQKESFAVPGDAEWCAYDVIPRSSRLGAGAFVATNPTDDSITVDLPGLNAPGVRFVIASFPLTDGARPSRDVKIIIAWSVDGRIQNYSRGGHHDPNQCYTTRQRAGRCNSSV